MVRRIQAINPMRFRITIRDLLWLTVVAALVVGWWEDRSRLDSGMRNLQIEAADLRERLSQKESIYLNGQRAPIYHSITP
jgi:hypothetical protein